MNPTLSLTDNVTSRIDGAPAAHQADDPAQPQAHSHTLDTPRPLVCMSVKTQLPLMRPSVLQSWQFPTMRGRPYASTSFEHWLSPPFDVVQLEGVEGG